MPLLSTFGGENVPDYQWAEFKRKVGDVLVVPGFTELLPARRSLIIAPTLTA